MGQCLPRGQLGSGRWGYNALTKSNLFIDTGVS